MQTKVAQWGNSLALRLPKHIAESVKLTDGQTVDLEIDDDTLVIRPSRKRYKLSDLLDGYKRPTQSAETDWGGPKGDEAW